MARLFSALTDGFRHDQLHSSRLSSRWDSCFIIVSGLCKWLFLVGKVRLAKWFTTMPPKAKSKIVKDVTQLVLARRTRMCNFLEYKGMYMLHQFTFFQAGLCECGVGIWWVANTDTKVVYRRYASLFFVCGIGSDDNELVTLEVIHRYVEVLDRYFGNVLPFWGVFFFFCDGIPDSFMLGLRARSVSKRLFSPAYRALVEGPFCVTLASSTSRRHMRYGCGWFILPLELIWVASACRYWTSLSLQERYRSRQRNPCYEWCVRQLAL